MEVKINKKLQGDISKGGFYSEGADTFVISSSRRTLLFSWAWIWDISNDSNYVKYEPESALKAQIVKWSTIWAFRVTSAQENNKVWLFEEMSNVSAGSELKPPLIGGWSGDQRL